MCEEHAPAPRGMRALPLSLVAYAAYFRCSVENSVLLHEYVGTCGCSRVVAQS